MLNALSFDIEDWYHIAGLKNPIPFSEWDKQHSRAVDMTRYILELLSENKTRATFFVLGYIAEKFPSIAADIYKNNHEISLHGYRHELLTDLTPERFSNDIDLSLNILKKICPDIEVKGYRAPSFSLTEATGWALGILEQKKFKYDSSIFPARRADGGIKTVDVTPYRISDNFWEFPISTVKIMGIRFAFSGGGYFRLFPYQFIRQGIKRLNSRGVPVIIYLHPRDFDVGTPRLEMPLWKKFKCYVNLHTTSHKLKRLLKEFRFAPVSEVLGIK